MQAVCAEAARRGVAVGAQVSYADRENFGRVALRRARGPADRAGGRAGRRAGRDRGRRGRRGRATSSRTARSTTGCRRRRRAGGGGAGRVRRPAGARACPASLLLALAGGRGPRRRGSRASPTAATPRRPAGAARPARRAGRRTSTRSPRRRGRPGRAGSTRSACTATSPGAVAAAGAVRRALEAAGFDVVVRPAGPSTGREPRSCGGCGACPVEHGTTSVGNPVGPRSLSAQTLAARCPGGIELSLPTPLRRGRGSDRTNSSTRRACSPRRPGDGDGGGSGGRCGGPDVTIPVKPRGS